MPRDQIGAPHTLVVPTVQRGEVHALISRPLRNGLGHAVDLHIAALLLVLALLRQRGPSAIRRLIVPEWVDSVNA